MSPYCVPSGIYILEGIQPPSKEVLIVVFQMEKLGREVIR